MKVLWVFLLAVVRGAEWEGQADSEEGEQRMVTPTTPSSTSEASTTATDTTFPHLNTTPPTTTPPPLFRPVDCADHLMAGATVSGVYEIYPFTCTCSKPKKVLCDMATDGGGWTVFLKRQRQVVQLDFNRTWDAYRDGFGRPDEEHWLGNEILHIMTNSRRYTLGLDMKYASGGYSFVTWNSMRVKSESNRYGIEIGRRATGSSSSLRCLSYLNNRYFSTRDRDNDYYYGNCASEQGGGWWYYNCKNFAPTSPFNVTLDLNCYSLSLKVTKLQLKIRPDICDSSFKTIHQRGKRCGC